MKTYKELVNNILIRLREKEIVTIADNSYSKLIGIFVQDAIEYVESSWSWSNLRHTFTVATQANTHVYTITGSGDKSTVLAVINDTSNGFLSYKNPLWFDDKFLNGTPPVATPTNYTFDGLDSSGNTKIKLYFFNPSAFQIITNIIIVIIIPEIIIPQKILMINLKGSFFGIFILFI